MLYVHLTHLIVSLFFSSSTSELIYDDVFRVWETIWAAEFISSRHFVLFIAAALVQLYRDVIIANNMDFTDISMSFAAPLPPSNRVSFCCCLLQSNSSMKWPKNMMFKRCYEHRAISCVEFRCWSMMIINDVFPSVFCFLQIASFFFFAIEWTVDLHFLVSSIIPVSPFLGFHSFLLSRTISSRCSIVTHLSTLLHIIF